MRRAAKIIGTIVLFLVVAVGLAATIAPRFLDRIYYRGAPSGHFDGVRFANPDGEDTGTPSGGRAGFLWRQLTGRDGRPSWPDRVAAGTTKPVPRIEGDRMVATWVGHATMLVQTRGLNILTDPVWAATAGPFGVGPNRVTTPGIALADLPPIDLIVVSHNHYDHMDLATLKRLWARDHPRIVTSLGNDSVIRQAGVPATALDWGGRTVLAPGIEVAVTRNHHWGSRWFTDRNRARWSSFVILLPGGNIFFAGDTGMGDGRWPVEAAALGPVRLAILPIGAFRFAPGQMESGSHIGPVDAVEVDRLLGATRAIPIHWGTFHLSYEGRETPPALLAAATRCTGQTGFTPVAIGVPTVIPAYAPPASRPSMTRAALLRCLDTPAVRGLP